MFIIDFSSTPAVIGRAFSLTPQLCTTPEKWTGLCNALEGVRYSSEDDNANASAILMMAAADLIDDAPASEKTRATVQADLVGLLTFVLPYNQHVTIMTHPTTRGYFSVHACISEITIQWVLASLLRDRVNFTCSPSNSTAKETRESIETVDIESPSGRLTRQILDQLNSLYEEPGSLAHFYDSVFPHLQELFLYAAAYLAIRDKWNRHDWLMDGIIAHVKRVLTEVKVCLDERRPSIFSWLDDPSSLPTEGER